MCTLYHPFHLSALVTAQGALHDGPHHTHSAGTPVQRTESNEDEADVLSKYYVYTLSVLSV